MKTDIPLKRLTQLCPTDLLPLFGAAGATVLRDVYKRQDEQLPWLAHVAIATPDIERLAGFYHGLLGGERRGGQKIGPNPLYDQITGLQNVEVIPTWIVGANITLELWQYLHPPTLPSSQLRPLNQPGYSHLCMQVESLATAMEYIAAAGGQIVSSISKQDACSSCLLYTSRCV